MRIRKAEKQLGWASEYRTAPSPPASSDSAAGLLICEQNPSSSAGDSINYRREDLEAANDSSEMATAAAAAGNLFQAKEDEEKKEESENKTEEKETKPMDVMRCKKTDGKRWQCNRAAKLPHSLCNYHLTQLRSYRARFEDQISGDHRKKAFLAVDRGGGAASNYYYYYSVLGPWWGKRRGPINGSKGESAGCNDRLEFESSREVGNGDGKTEQEGVGVDEEDGGGGSCFEVKCCKKKKKKKVSKKRGRKAVKSRSLKSLM